MDSTAHIPGLIDQLDDNLDDLQDAIQSILSKSLTEVAANYPVLDRAKLYILVTYAIESAIFSFLRLTGTSAREHPVYRELERVKQYFQKAKLAETTGQKPGMRLDQAAAGRFIKAALAGNDAGTVKKGAAINLESSREANETGLSESDNPRKRRASNMDQQQTVSVNTQDDDDSPGESDEDEESSTSGAVSSQAVSQSVTPTKSHSMSGEDAARKAEVKRAARQRKKERKRKAKGASDQIVSADASLHGEPNAKKQKKNKKGKKSKSKAS